MTTTTYYNLNIVEGTDIVNPLSVDNPNYETIDEVMHNNAVSGVTLATEIANATVHAIARENSECAVIRFIATSNWKAGDTITVDGVPVTALLPSGETLPDGAYVINANVLCILTGTNLTVFAERKKVEKASEISYGNTNVQEELNKIKAHLNWKNVFARTVSAIGSYNFFTDIPNDAEEIMVYIALRSESNNISIYGQTFNFRPSLANGNERFAYNIGVGDGRYVLVNFNLSLTAINIREIMNTVFPEYGYVVYVYYR